MIICFPEVCFTPSQPMNESAQPVPFQGEGTVGEQDNKSYPDDDKDKIVMIKEENRKVEGDDRQI